MASFYMQWHGPNGLKKIAKKSRFFIQILMQEMEDLGIKWITDSTNYFDTIAIDVKASGFSSSDWVLSEFHKHGINLRKIDDKIISISVDELTTLFDLDQIIEIFHDMKKSNPSEQHMPFSEYEGLEYKGLPASLKRESKYLAHTQFSMKFSETTMMRYIQRLANKDVGLTDSMIPLGSCTMKLNSAVAMVPITWGGFCNLHPFAPLDQAVGFQQLIREIEDDLIAITQYDGISSQPHSGATGEYAGLMAIKKYHESRGEGHRNICIIPTSAHGTNPATAVICGMKIVPVGCDE